MRLGDLDALKADFKERNIWSKDIVDAIDNAPSVINEYTKGFADGERSGRHFPLTDEEKAILVRQWRTKGEWIKIGEIGLAYKCNRCGEVAVVPTNFCSHCGADMGGVESHLDNTPTAVINKDFYKTDKSNPINRSDLFQ